MIIRLNPLYITHSQRTVLLTLFVSRQFCLWDKFKALEGLSTGQLTSLAKFNALLVAKGAMPLSMLKVR